MEKYDPVEDTHLTYSRRILPLLIPFLAIFGVRPQLARQRAVCSANASNKKQLQFFALIWLQAETSIRSFPLKPRLVTAAREGEGKPRTESCFLSGSFRQFASTRLYGLQTALEGLGALSTPSSRSTSSEASRARLVLLKDRCQQLLPVPPRPALLQQQQLPTYLRTVRASNPSPLYPTASSAR